MKNALRIQFGTCCLDSIQQNLDKFACELTCILPAKTVGAFHAHLKMADICVFRYFEKAITFSDS